MPKLINRPPQYRLHKSTGQAVVSVHGKVIQLGPFGSQKSHARYQEEIANWRALRLKQEVEEAFEPEPEVSLKELQTRRMRGYPVTIDELALAYLDFARGYYKKNGRVTREAEIIAITGKSYRLRHQAAAEQAGGDDSKPANAPISPPGSPTGRKRKAATTGPAETTTPLS